MMLKRELADFRRDMEMDQATFGAWLSEKMGRSRAYTNTEVSNWETGARDVPYAVQAAIYKHLWETKEP